MFKNYYFIILSCFVLGYAVTASVPVNILKKQSFDNHWIAPKWTDTLIAPNLLNQSLIQKGNELFNSHCAVCHGENGKGDGEAGFGLSVPPGDLTESPIISETNGSLFWKINTGRAPMPSYSEKLAEIEVWSLVAYIRNLQTHHLLKVESKKNKKK